MNFLEAFEAFETCFASTADWIFLFDREPSDGPRDRQTLS